MTRHFAQFIECARMVEVPSAAAVQYVMFHQMPCRSCYNGDERASGAQ